MKLSTKGRYGARAMLDLALNSSRAPVLLKDIAKRQNISLRYLENIMLALVTAGVATSTRGKQGGFQLARPPERIRLSAIISAVEGPLIADCVENSASCKRSSFCVTNEIWKKMRDAMLEVLDSVTLKDMIKMYNKKAGKSADQMYYI